MYHHDDVMLCESVIAVRDAENIDGLNHKQCGLLWSRGLAASLALNILSANIITAVHASTFLSVYFR